MNNKSSGMSAIGVLTLIFIVLKLIGVIKWSWLWVLCPIWITLLLYLIIILIVVFLT